MIYATNKNAEDSDFVSLLEATRESLLKTISDGKNYQPLEFEGCVYEVMRAVAKGTKFDGTIERTGKFNFPDILANKYFGVEVKMTKQDKWVSTGNSIFETTRVENVGRIFILFGKFGGEPDVRYKLYQDCLSSIKVTHSPRYIINMELTNRGSIFKNMGIDYETFRNNGNKIYSIKEYYKKQLRDGEELWWIDEEQDKTVSPVIRPFQKLNQNEKEDFIVESMILFPEIFGNSTLKFERAAIYLITKYNVVCVNLRDVFTAGGKKGITVKRRRYDIPQIFLKMHERARMIEEKIKEIDIETLLYYWRAEKLDKDRVSQWKNLLKKTNDPINQGKIGDALRVSIADIFNDGLRK